MSSTTKIYEEKMNNCVAHLDRELTSIRAGRANPGILDKVMVDYYGSPTPVQQVASVAVSEARILTITPWDGTLIKAISKAIQTSDIGINPIDDGHTFLSWEFAGPVILMQNCMSPFFFRFSSVISAVSSVMVRLPSGVFGKRSGVKLITPRLPSMDM